MSIATECHGGIVSKTDPLDGSVSGTIGGGGRETGGPTERPEAPDMPPVKPENAASGRLDPDLVDNAIETDELGRGPSDVSNVDPDPRRR
jgi:hypothetical protein